MPPPTLTPSFAWFLAGMVFFVLELLFPGFVLFFFGLGCWCTMAVVWLSPLGLAAQLAIFLGASVLSLLMLRAWLRQVFAGGARQQADSAAAELVGQRAVVTRAIRPPDIGQVRCGGTFWRAEADVPLPEGAVVEVAAQRELVLSVRPLATQVEDDSWN